MLKEDALAGLSKLHHNLMYAMANIVIIGNKFRNGSHSPSLCRKALISPDSCIRLTSPQVPLKGCPVRKQPISTDQTPGFKDKKHV